MISNLNKLGLTVGATVVLATASLCTGLTYQSRMFRPGNYVEATPLVREYTQKQELVRKIEHLKNEIENQSEFPESLSGVHNIDDFFKGLDNTAVLDELQSYSNDLTAQSEIMKGVLNVEGYFARLAEVKEDAQKGVNASAIVFIGSILGGVGYCAHLVKKIKKEEQS